MQRTLEKLSLLPLMALFLTGCSTVGEKSGNLSIIYGVTAFLSLMILVGYFFVSKKKDPWFLLLLASVLVVNIGYYVLAVSSNLSEALTANRIAYLGSVFLPLSMWMIILSVTHIRFPKWISVALLGLGIVVFLIAASPGYSDIYYKEVYFQKINGVTVLNKVYGPLHGIYLVYLLGYFGAMVTTIIHATLKDKVDSVSYAAILAVAVFVNIGVWLVEQLIQIDFEILSVSYIISECFLLGLRLFIAETEKQIAKPIAQPPADPPPETAPKACSGAIDPEDQAHLDLFIAGLARLTPKEQQLYDCYTSGMSTAEIMEQLCIKENTLKFHNKNLYSKLGISSRKQLLRFAAMLPGTEST